jgi:hypothetical protein
MATSFRRAHVLATLLAASCEACERHDLVPTGTYEGTIDALDVDTQEIYVDAGDKRLELYFTPQTRLVRGDTPVSFTELSVGQRVTVSVQNRGDHLDPETVRVPD